MLSSSHAISNFDSYNKCWEAEMRHLDEQTASGHKTMRFPNVESDNHVTITSSCSKWYNDSWYKYDELLHGSWSKLFCSIFQFHFYCNITCSCAHAWMQAFDLNENWVKSWNDEDAPSSSLHLRIVFLNQITLAMHVACSLNSGCQGAEKDWNDAEYEGDTSVGNKTGRTMMNMQDHKGNMMILERILLSCEQATCWFRLWDPIHSIPFILSYSKWTH